MTDHTERPASIPLALIEALVARGVTACGAVVAREGLPSGLEDPSGAAGALMGEDGLGWAFDALVSSGNLYHTDLLVVAVERSHQYRGTPAVLASGEASRWVDSLTDQHATDILYTDAGAEFERAQAEAVVAAVVNPPVAVPIPVVLDDSTEDWAKSTFDFWRSDTEQMDTLLELSNVLCQSELQCAVMVANYPFPGAVPNKLRIEAQSVLGR